MSLSRSGVLEAFKQPPLYQYPSSALRLYLFCVLCDDVCCVFPFANGSLSSAVFVSNMETEEMLIHCRALILSRFSGSSPLGCQNKWLEGFLWYCYSFSVCCHSCVCVLEKILSSTFPSCGCVVFYASVSSVFSIIIWCAFNSSS